MTHGFIITLPTGCVPGTKCFVSPGISLWFSRYLEREMAHVFKTRDEAQDAIREMVGELRYEAPEINLKLAACFKEAQIVAVGAIL